MTEYWLMSDAVIRILRRADSIGRSQISQRLLVCRQPPLGGTWIALLHTR